ncbi:TPA: sensor histidine kinase [Enterococcus faecalis]
MKKKSWLSNYSIKIFILIFTIIFIFGFGILFLFSYLYFGNIFEDRVIDEYTLKKNKELGVKNEWIVGVTTHNIDVVEAIHGEEVRELVEELEHTQKESKKVYREKIDNKKLLIMIELDTKNGEQIYKYSLLRDIYLEVMPQILILFLLFLILIFSFTIIFFIKLHTRLYKNISIINKQANAFSENIYTAKNIIVESSDEDILTLVSSFNKLKNRIIEKDASQQSIIRFISHEMKTPTMIIKGYTNAALKAEYPKGTIEETLRVIDEQVLRIEQKTNDLLRISEVVSEQERGNLLESINLTNLIVKQIELFEIVSKKEIIFDDTKIFYINGYRNLINIFLENMIQNQINYSDKYISIEIEQHSSSITIFFKNDGQIVNLDDYPDILLPFSTKNPNGSGLGLTIVSEIIKIHNAEIDLVKDKNYTIFKISGLQLQYI